MKQWRVILEGRNHREVITFDAATEAAARAALANWLIDKPWHRLVGLAESN